jgi:hypothetical protein
VKDPNNYRLHRGETKGKGERVKKRESKNLIANKGYGTQAKNKMDVMPKEWLKQTLWYATMQNLEAIKGTVSRDFLLLVFFINQFPPSPWLCH